MFRARGQVWSLQQASAQGAHRGHTMIKETEEDVGPVEGPPSPIKLILRVLGRQERISFFLEPG